MTALRVLVVDDEAPARKRLREVLADCTADLQVEVVGEASSGSEALSWLERNSADVAIIDIRMPGMGGIELAERMQGLAVPPAVIFSTAYDQYAIAAFEVNATDYLLKPVRKERLLAALRKVRAFTRKRIEGAAIQSRKNLSIAERGKIILVPVADIAYMRAELKYVTIRTREREFLCEESLAHLEQEFAPRFLRIHRNCIVAKDYIAGFEKHGHVDGDGASAFTWLVVLRGLDEKLQVSRRHWHAVKDVVLTRD